MKALKSLLKFTIDKKKKTCPFNEKTVQSLIMLIHYIDDYNNKDGMYVDPGIPTEIAELEKVIISGTFTMKNISSIKNPHSAAIVIRDILHILEPPVIPSLKYAEFLRLSELNLNDKSTMFMSAASIESGYDSITNTMHKTLLDHILSHLCNIVQLRRDYHTVTFESLSMSVGNELLRNNGLMLDPNKSKSGGKDMADPDTTQDNLDYKARIAAMTNMLRWYSTTEQFKQNYPPPKTTADTTPMKHFDHLSSALSSASSAVKSVHNPSATPQPQNPNDSSVVPVPVIENMLDRSIKITFPKKKGADSTMDYEAHVRELLGQYSDIENIGVKDGRLAVVMFETIRSALIHLPYIEQDLRQLGYKITYLGGGEMIPVETSIVQPDPAPVETSQLSKVAHGDTGMGSKFNPGEVLNQSHSETAAATASTGSSGGWANAVVTTKPASSMSGLPEQVARSSWATSRRSIEIEPLDGEAKANLGHSSAHAVDQPAPTSPEPIKSISSSYNASSPAPQSEDGVESFVDISADEVSAFGNSPMHDDDDRKHQLVIENMDTVSGEESSSPNSRSSPSLRAKKADSSAKPAQSFKSEQSTSNDVTNIGHNLSANESSRGTPTTIHDNSKEIATDDAEGETKYVNPTLVRKISMSALVPKAIQVVASPQGGQHRKTFAGSSDEGNDHERGTSTHNAISIPRPEYQDRGYNANGVGNDTDSDSDSLPTYGNLASGQEPAHEDSDVPRGNAIVVPMNDATSSKPPLQPSTTSASASGRRLPWSEQESSTKLSTNADGNHAGSSASAKRVVVVSRRNLSPTLGSRVENDDVSRAATNAQHPQKLLSTPFDDSANDEDVSHTQSRSHHPASATRVSRSLEIEVKGHASPSGRYADHSPGKGAGSSGAPRLNARGNVHKQHGHSSPAKLHWEEKRTGYIKEKEIVELLQSRIQMLEAEAKVRERERQELEHESRRAEMEWSAELVSLCKRVDTLENEIVGANETIRQLKISNAHKDGELTSLRGTVEILNRTQADLKAKSERNALNAVLAQKQLAQLLNAQLATTDEAAKYSMSELTELREAYERAVAASLQWQVKARAAGLEIERLNKQLVAQMTSVVAQNDALSPHSNSEECDSLVLSGASGEKSSTDSSYRVDIRRPAEVGAESSAHVGAGAVGNSLMIQALRDTAWSETERYLQACSEEGIDPVNSEANRGELQIGSKHVSSESRPIVDGSTETDDLTGMSILNNQNRPNSSTPAPTRQSTQTSRQVRPTEADAEATVNRSQHPTQVHRQKVPAVNREPIGFADDELAENDDMHPSTSRVSHIELLKQADYEQSIGFGNFATPSQSAIKLSQSKPRQPIPQSSYGGLNANPSYAIRGITSDLSYLRKQMSAGMSSSSQQQQPQLSSSSARGSIGRDIVDSKASPQTTSIRGPSQRDIQLLMKYGAMADTRLSSDTEELLRRIRQRQQDLHPSVASENIALNRHQDLLSAKRWYENNVPGYSNTY